MYVLCVVERRALISRKDAINKRRTKGKGHLTDRPILSRISDTNVQNKSRLTHPFVSLSFCLCERLCMCEIESVCVRRSVWDMTEMGDNFVASLLPHSPCPHHRFLSPPAALWRQTAAVQFPSASLPSQPPTSGTRVTELSPLQALHGFRKVLRVTPEVTLYPQTPLSPGARAFVWRIISLTLFLQRSWGRWMVGTEGQAHCHLLVAICGRKLPILWIL